MFTHAYTHIHIQIHTPMHILACVYACSCTHNFMWVHTHVNIHTFMCRQIHTHSLMCTCIHTIQMSPVFTWWRYCMLTYNWIFILLVHNKIGACFFALKLFRDSPRELVLLQCFIVWGMMQDSLFKMWSLYFWCPSDCYKAKAQESHVIQSLLSMKIINY